MELIDRSHKFIILQSRQRWDKKKSSNLFLAHKRPWLSIQKCPESPSSSTIQSISCQGEKLEMWYKQRQGWKWVDHLAKVLVKSASIEMLPRLICKIGSSFRIEMSMNNSKPIKEEPLRLRVKPQQRSQMWTVEELDSKQASHRELLVTTKRNMEPILSFSNCWVDNLKLEQPSNLSKMRSLKIYLTQ